ncbi:MAG: AraC family transcriptional regulator [Pseudomonadota bacterium]
MTSLSGEILRTKLESMGQEVHFVHVTQDQQVIIYRSRNVAFSDAIQPLPWLLVHLCVSGGGPLRHTSNFVQIEEEIAPGAIGVIPPGAKGTGHWPEMLAITIAISAKAVAASFGKSWMSKLKSRVMSQIFQDPLVEATMMDIGYTRAGNISDEGLKHAAYMITHQLLGQPFDTGENKAHVMPLSKVTMDRIVDYLESNIGRHVSVSEMSQIAGVSRHHFSRRFKAATGHSPLQYFIKRKLDHAASLLELGQNTNVSMIAQEVGFSNPSHFARAFRRHFGISPRHWKLQQARSQAVYLS